MCRLLRRSRCFLSGVPALASLCEQCIQEPSRPHPGTFEVGPVGKSNKRIRIRPRPWAGSINWGQRMKTRPTRSGRQSYSWRGRVRDPAFTAMLAVQRLIILSAPFAAMGFARRSGSSRERLRPRSIRSAESDGSSRRSPRPTGATLWRDPCRSGRFRKRAATIRSYTRSESVHNPRLQSLSVCKV
jgi:hypothetical protein